MTIERRRYPRYTVDLPVTVSLPQSKDSYEVRANSLSCNSMQVGCGAPLVSALQAQKTLPQECTVQFQLPDHDYKFKAAAQLVSYRRRSREEYFLVLAFELSSNKAFELLNEQLG